MDNNVYTTHYTNGSIHEFVRSSEPICDCDLDTLSSLAAEWQHRLFLDNWIIKVAFTDELIEPGTGKPLMGGNEFQFENRVSLISILSRESYEKSGPCSLRYCVEATLVHELLHLKYNWIKPDDSYEGVYVDATEHALLEEMSRSLIMAKYGVSLSWFASED